MPKGPDERGKSLVDVDNIINLPDVLPEVGNLLDYFTDGMHDDFVDVEVYARMDYYDGDDELLGWWTFVVDGGEEVPGSGTYLVGRLDFCSSQEVFDRVVNVLPGRFALHLCGGKGYCPTAKMHDGLKVWHAVSLERVRYGKRERIKKPLPMRRAVGARTQEGVGSSGGALVLADPGDGGVGGYGAGVARALKAAAEPGGGAALGLPPLPPPGGRRGDGASVGGASTPRDEIVGARADEHERARLQEERLEMLKKRLEEAKDRHAEPPPAKKPNHIDFLEELKSRYNKSFDRLVQKHQEKRKSKARRRRRGRGGSGSERDDSLSSASSSSVDGVFTEARRAGRSMVEVAVRSPGVMVRSMLRRVKHFLQSRRAHSTLDELDASGSVYYQTMILSQYPHMNLRSQRELKTLFLILDDLCRGDAVAAMDVVAQRIKAVETAEEEGTWQSATHVELAPEAQSSLRSEAEKAHAAKRARDAVRYGLAPRTRSPHSRSRSRGVE
jgi:hypothetical protein